jgi:hypothetical protein
MPLIEALTLQVGPAIAKAILKFWLKDRKFASDIASSLVDLLKSKTTDVIAQRRASRRFEEIGEKVAESLLPVFEMEGAHLDESSCTAVALALAEALNKSPIDAELLAMRDLDPTKLMGYLLECHPSATQHFSAAEGALYQRIISEPIPLRSFPCSSALTLLRRATRAGPVDG